MGLLMVDACSCGVRFAAGLLRCPRCGVVAARFGVRMQEEEKVPRITVASGPSNAGAQPGEVGYVEPAVEDAAPSEEVAVAEEAPQAPEALALEGEHGPEVADLPPGDLVEPLVASAPDYGSMTQAALRDEAKARSLPVGGSKADLAQRLAEHDAGPAETEA